MATTFDPALTDDLSKVRFEIGDAGDGDGNFTSAAEVQDETISAFLALPLAVIPAAARVAWYLVAKYAAMVDVTVDHQMTRASQRYQQYLALAKRLDAAASAGARSGPIPAPTGLDGPIVLGIGDRNGPLGPCDAWGGYPGYRV